MSSYRSPKVPRPVCCRKISINRVEAASPTWLYFPTAIAESTLTVDGQPRTVEFNCRLGDPEAQPLLLRLKSDLFDLLMQATAGQGAHSQGAHSLDEIELQWDRRVALGVVVASAGYPSAPRSGDRITGLPAAAEDVKVFHAGTALRGNDVVTAGGRVLCVTALGDSTRLAQQRAYAAARGIAFDGAQMRKDIGQRALKR